MAYLGFNNLWESKFDEIVSKKDNVQYLNINQLKLELHDSYKKDEKLSTNFEPVNNEHVINKVFEIKHSKYYKNRSHIQKK